MRRRKFLEKVSLGAAGIGLIGSCKGETKGRADLTDSLTSVKIPGYRANIKSSFSPSGTIGANDRVVLALIGAGNWGTGLALTVSDLNKNIVVKYICDVDDTRGGRVGSEIGKKQGFEPVQVKRKLFITLPL